MALGSIDVFPIFILPQHEHGMFFHLFVSSSISFISVLWVLEHRLFTSSVKCIPRYLMVLGAIVNGIYSLISLSSVSLLVYRNATYFCAFILYTATLLNCCMSFSNFEVESKNQLLVSFIFSTVLLSISVSFALIFTISLHQLGLGIICCSFSGSIRWKVFEIFLIF